MREPYFISVDGDERAGVVHADMLGMWHAAAWCGSLGTFPNEVLAVEAIGAAPKRPRTPRLQKAQKPGPPKLVESDAAGRVFQGKRQIGGWIKVADGYAAWTTQGKGGVHETPGLAAKAATAAFLEDQSAKAKAWAARRKGKEP